MQHISDAKPLDPNELEGLKFPHVTTLEQLNHLELANIESGCVWLNKKRNVDFFTEKFLRDLHKNLFSEVWSWAGKYRCTEKNIGVAPLQIASQVVNLLNDAKYWYENRIFSPMEATVRFHHRLVFVHPFPNGNGRHSRIMANYMLEKIYKRQPIDWSGGFELQHQNKRRAQYIIALKAANSGDYTPLLLFCKN